MLPQGLMENLSNFQHVEDLIIAERVIYIYRNHAQFLLAIKILILFIVDGQDIEKL